MSTLPGTWISDEYAAGHTGFSARCADLVRVLNLYILLAETNKGLQRVYKVYNCRQKSEKSDNNGKLK